MRAPACLTSTGCLCAGHARGNAASAACDTSEKPPAKPRFLKPLCPNCGAQMRRCKSGSQGCLHCTRGDCDGMRQPPRGI